MGPDAGRAHDAHVAEVAVRCSSVRWIWAFLPGTRGTEAPLRSYRLSAIWPASTVFRFGVPFRRPEPGVREDGVWGRWSPYRWLLVLSDREMRVRRCSAAMGRALRVCGVAPRRRRSSRRGTEILRTGRRGIVPAMPSARSFSADGMRIMIRLLSLSDTGLPSLEPKKSGTPSVFARDTPRLARPNPCRQFPSGRPGGRPSSTTGLNSRLLPDRGKSCGEGCQPVSRQHL